MSFDADCKDEFYMNQTPEKKILALQEIKSMDKPSVDKEIGGISEVTTSKELEDPNNSSTTFPVEPEAQWTPRERSLFRLIWPIFSHKYCVLAKLIMSKNCKQVYAFAQKEFVDCPEENVTGENLSDATISQRMKKKPKSVWIRRFNKIAKDRSPGKRPNYTPCYHPGQPCDKYCSCVKEKTYCEKFCRCSKNCQQRFPGCRCRTHCSNNRCPCYVAIRECDPDLCNTCGAADYGKVDIPCKNVNVQRRLCKCLLVGRSSVAGDGAFLKHNAQKNEFLHEYRGELISHFAAEIRGYFYNKRKCSYLFDLNDDFVLDSTYRGTEARFLNHSNDPNCYARVLMVNGDHRIGIFAKKDIQAGEELFFDYNYSPSELKKHFGIKRMSA